MEILLSILPDKNWHKDFLIKIDGIEEYADTYYFWTEEFGKLENPYNAICNRVSKYLSKWVDELRALPVGKELFMPINFSDEYVGGFKIKSLNGYFNIAYGYIYEINNIVVQVGENSIYTNLNDKVIDSRINIDMEKEQFLKSLTLLSPMS